MTLPHEPSDRVFNADIDPDLESILAAVERSTEADAAATHRAGINHLRLSAAVIANLGVLQAARPNDAARIIQELHNAGVLQNPT